MQAFINEYGGQMLTKSAEHLYISAIALGLVSIDDPFFRCREISGDYRTVYLFTFADFAKYLYRDEKC